MEPRGTSAVNDSLASDLGDGRSISPAVPVVGVTGTGGAGTSSLVDELPLRFRQAFPDLHRRPDIYGKVGNSGVSIGSVDDILAI